MSILRSHLAPGWPERAKWRRPARLHSSRTAGRAAGASLLFSFLSRPHIQQKHLLLSFRHLFHTFTPQGAPSKPPEAAAAAAGEESDFSDKLCQKIPETTSPAFSPPLQAQGTRCAGNLLHRSGAHIARRGAKTLSGFMCTAWKVDSRSHREVQQQEATCSEPRAPSLCLPAHAVRFPRAATRRRQTQTTLSRWNVSDSSTFPSCEPNAARCDRHTRQRLDVCPHPIGWAHLVHLIMWECERRKLELKASVTLASREPLSGTKSFLSCTCSKFAKHRNNKTLTWVLYICETLHSLAIIIII